MLIACVCIRILFASLVAVVCKVEQQFASHWQNEYPISSSLNAHQSRHPCLDLNDLNPPLYLHLFKLLFRRFSYIAINRPAVWSFRPYLSFVLRSLILRTLAALWAYINNGRHSFVCFAVCVLPSYCQHRQQKSKDLKLKRHSCRTLH